MKTITPTIFLLLVSNYFFSCKAPECGSCELMFPPVKFKIVNNAGQNLVFGPGKIYTSNKINIKYIESATLTDAPKLFSGDTTSAQSSFMFYGQLFNQYYLYIDGVKTDSFQLSYQHNSPTQDCCPGFNTITLLKLNNVPTSYVYPGTADPVNVIK